MIEAKKFEWLLKDLGETTTMPTENQIGLYYQHLKNNDERLLRKAVNLLQETYTYRRLPLIAEIKQAVKDAFNDSTEPSIKLKEPEGCDKCKGIGIIIREKLWFGKLYSYAIPCTCAKGKIYKKAWEPYNPKKIRMEA